VLAACSSPGGAADPVTAEQSRLVLDRAEFREAMNQLDALYAAPEGLQRPDGLSIAGRPDFEGIAAWVFDVYLASRASGLSRDQAFGNVRYQVEQSGEWQAKHPGAGPSARWTPFGQTLALDRDEFRWAMERLDHYYGSEDGLQRPDGLSIGGRPDFEGIAAWVFDVYLNARLAGATIDVAWRQMVAQIEQSGEWRSRPRRGVDASTLYGKHLMGYQGWFGAPGDGWNGSWVHWFSGDGSISNATFDVWPDTRELDPDELYADSLLPSRSGGPSRLFSSHNRKTVLRHFRWMKESGIDGVSVGRFSVGAVGASRAAMNDVLDHCREGAEASGRVFFIWYDVTGHSAATFVQDIENDWVRLVDEEHITASPSYLRHRGRPLLGVWGVGIGDRPGTPADWAALTQFFKNHPDPRYRVTLLAGGIPGWSTDPSWSPIFKQMDVISPWTVGAFADDAGADNFLHGSIEPDLKVTKALGIDYLPIAFPGFSWHNLQSGNSPVNVFPRRGGRFYWHQVSNIVGAGANVLFTAMFDEVDEGTAMIKAAPSQASTPAVGSFLTLDADGERLSSDFYLRLGGAAGQLLRHEIPAGAAIPIRPY
jgi:hypothetical protein